MLIRMSKYTLSTRRKALGRNFIRNERIDEVSYFLPGRDFFTPITRESIQPGDWLHERDPKGQMFHQYTRYNPIYRKKNKIYIVPLEDEFEKQNEFFKMEDLAEYIEAFYGGSAIVDVMNTKSIVGFKESVKNIRVRENDFGPQLFTPEVLKLLKTIIPNDAYACIAITSLDLFNKDTWNYVCGIASLRNRIGVFSYRRFIEDDVFKRISRLSTHEIGHIFGLKHCHYYQCHMNGINGPDESFKKPPRLCPVCLRKLKKNCKFSIRKRYLSLLKVYEKHGHADQVDWIKRRMKYSDRLSNMKLSLTQYKELFNRIK